LGGLLRGVVARAAGHGGRPERSDPVAAVAEGDDLRKLRIELRAIVDARGVRGQFRVARLLWNARDLAQPRELPVVADRHHDVTVPGGEGAIRDDARMRVAEPLRWLPGEEIVLR